MIKVLQRNYDQSTAVEKVNIHRQFTNSKWDEKTPLQVYAADLLELAQKIPNLIAPVTLDMNMQLTLLG